MLLLLMLLLLMLLLLMLAVQLLLKFVMREWVVGVLAPAAAVAGQF
jgi:hypothetical protein